MTTSGTKSNSDAPLPRRRPASEFIVEVLPDETLIYDRSSHRAHCLSPAAAFVWERCDGVTTRGDAERALTSSGLRESLDGVLAQLASAALLMQPAPTSRLTVNGSRRQLLSRGAVVAGVVLASPVVFSIVAPSVAEAASVGCGKIGQPCCLPANSCNPPLSCENGFCT